MIMMLLQRSLRLGSCRLQIPIVEKVSLTSTKYYSRFGGLSPLPLFRHHPARRMLCCSSTTSASSSPAASPSAASPSSSSSELANTGSTARDHLANERTFLAFSRTGLAFLGAGAAIILAINAGTPPDDIIEQLPKRILPASALLFANGAVFLTFATSRYFAVQRQLIRGNFAPTKKGLVAVIAFTAISTSASIAFLIKDLIVQS